MGIKKDPGEYDCYANAADDEPLFVLRSTDVLAPLLVAIWASLRENNEDAADMFLTDAKNIAHRRGKRIDKKSAEAFKCADAMRAYRNMIEGHKG